MSNINKIESCLRLFTKRIKGLSDMRYPDHLVSLGLETLQATPLKCDLQMCYKVIHNQITVLNDDLLVFADCMSTRGHCYKLYKGYSQVNTHKYFFINRTVFMISGIHYCAQ